MRDQRSSNRAAGRGIFVGVRSFLGLIATLLSVLSLANAARAQDGEIVGIPWTGEPGITETVDQIMARDYLYPPPTTPQTTGKPKRISPDRSKLPMAPDNLGAVAAWPPLPDGVPAITPRGYSDRNPQVLGTVFNGVQLSESGFVPPDTIGDVSPTQIIAAANGRIKVFSRTGVVGSLNATMNTFFNSVRNASTVSDPVVRYDRISGRWFVIGITTSTPNRIVLAVSGTGTITGTASFTFFFFQQDLVGTTPNADTGTFADYCTLGVDASALYIGCRMFNPSFYGCTGWVVNKANLIAGTLTVTVFRQMTTTTTGPDAPRGVSNDDATATQGYFIGADVAANSRLVIRRVSTPGGTPTLSANLNITVPATSVPVNVPAQGSTINVEAVDDRLFAAHVRKNRATGVATLWTSHAIETNSAGTGTAAGDRDSMRWYEVQNLTTTPSLRQSGTLFDSAAATPRWYWMGSCNMSGQGHMALGASFAATDEFIGCATAGRFSSDTLGTIQAPTDIVAGVGAYTVDFGSGRNRWGDYSHTVSDPADDMTMWTFQEYASAANTWSVRVIQLRAPAPATPSSCSPSSIAQGASNVSVVLTGTSASGTGFFDPDATFPNHISAAVGGTGVTVNSVTWTSATQITLNVTVAAAATPGARTITVTNPDGQTAVSATGILTVSGGCVAPSMTTQPASSSICAGANSSFTIVAGGTAPMTFQWRRGTTNLSNGGTISGATSSTLTITGAGTGDAAADYNCVVTNACGNITSNNASLTVNVAPGISTQPASTSACAGGNASFSIVATGSPTYQWRKGFTNLVNGGTISGATSPTLTITGVVAGDAANYTCVLSNSCGNLTSNIATLGINSSPSITTQPTALTRCTGTSASFSIAVAGIPAPTLQWRKNGSDILGATGTTYTIPAVLPGDSGNYDCVVTNSCSSITSNSVALSVNTAPSITTNPANDSACPGDPASFSVAASGTPAPTFQWRRNATNISGATAAIFNIPSVSAADAGNYDCLVTNSCGSATSAVAVLSLDASPSISIQPTGSTRCLGDEYTFSIAAAGTPAPTYQWRLNGSNLSGATLPFLGLNGISSGDAGTYDCVVTNACGSVTSNPAVLSVQSGPSISTQPSAQSVAAGASASFSVVASGSPTLSYAWRKDTVNLSNAGNVSGADTDTLTINPAAAGDAGSYDCVVTNPCGSATSDAATLAVTTGCITDVDDGSFTGTRDGGVTIDDLLYYLFIFENGDLAADVDDGSGTGTLDNGVTIDDLLYFLVRFELGC